MGHQAPWTRSMRNRGGRLKQLGWCVVLLLGACGAPTSLPPAAAMLGEWNYSSAPVASDRPSLNAGLLVTIAVESRSEETRLNSSHVAISYAVFCLKKKKKKLNTEKKG